MGRLVNIFKLFVYFWWLHVASHLCLAIWSTLGNAIDKQERASFAVNALNFLILVKIWDQIEYMHQSFSDVFSRFNLKAGVLVTGILSLIGIYLSNSIAASSLVTNSCDLGGSLLSNLFCHSSQPKSIVLSIFSAALGIYYIFLYQSYKRTGKGFLPKNALINADPSCLRAGDMVLTPIHRFLLSRIIALWIMSVSDHHSSHSCRLWSLVLWVIWRMKQWSMLNWY